MPDLSFEVHDAEAMRDSVMPAIALQVKISNRLIDEPVQTIVLRCQIQIESPRRRYTEREKEALRDVFGEPERWGQTLRPMLWTNVAATVPAFTGAATVMLPVACTFDFNVSATKYLHALEDGVVPVTLLFSGTVFYQSAEGRLQAAPIPWNSETAFRFPVRVWKECMDLHYPNTAWVCLRRDIFERLYGFKVREGAATLDEAIERMLETREQVGIGWTAR